MLISSSLVDFQGRSQSFCKKFAGIYLWNLKMLVKINPSQIVRNLHYCQLLLHTDTSPNQFNVKRLITKLLMGL